MKPAIEKEKEKKTYSKKLEKNKQPFSQDKMSGEEESCEKWAIFPFVSIGKGWPLKGQSVKRTPYEEKKINMGKLLFFLQCVSWKHEIIYWKRLSHNFLVFSFRKINKIRYRTFFFTFCFVCFVKVIRIQNVSEWSEWNQTDTRMNIFPAVTKWKSKSM